MTIEAYIKTVNMDFDIFDVCELDFVEKDNTKEAKENLLWVIKEAYGLKPLDILQMIAIVVVSYHGGVVEWEQF